MAIDDESLARLARAGGSSAMDTLVRRWQIPIVRFLERRIGNRTEAEDLFQETFVRIYQNLDAFDDRRSFKTWIFTIAWRLAANHLRDRKRAGNDDVLQGVADDAPTPHDLAAEDDTHRGLWAIAKRVLSADYYNVLWLCYVEQLSPREIAEVTGRSWVGVKTAMHRARKALAPHVQHLQKDGVA
jgi:RNA polymerase sigma-70 factor, ECF subfamily